MMYTWIVTTHNGNETLVQADTWATSDGMLIFQRKVFEGEPVVAAFAKNSWISFVRQP